MTLYTKTYTGLLIASQADFNGGNLDQNEYIYSAGDSSVMKTRLVAPAAPSELSQDFSRFDSMRVLVVTNRSSTYDARMRYDVIIATETFGSGDLTWALKGALPARVTRASGSFSDSEFKPLSFLKTEGSVVGGSDNNGVAYRIQERFSTYLSLVESQDFTVAGSDTGAPVLTNYVRNRHVVSPGQSIIVCNVNPAIEGTTFDFQGVGGAVDIDVSAIGVAA